MKRLLMTGLLIFGAISSGRTAMAKKIDKEVLANKIKALAGLDAEERSELLGLLSERKKYGLVWEEKPEDVEEVMREQLPVLAEVKERAIVAPVSSAPNHILIEGDNLHALTCLTYTHSNKVDVIYIDPPYNTGNKDFVYNDSFVDKEDAFRHSKWLSFMEKRLRIAKGLLSDKGVIFISIDDNEQAQLKLLCDEIFGEENFIGHITWESTTQPTNAGTALFQLQKKVEFILCYAKCNGIRNQFKLREIHSENNYPHHGRFGKCRFEVIEKSDVGRFKRDTMKFRILGQYPRAGKRWQIGEETARELERLGKVEIVNGIVKRAVYPEDENNVSYIPFWSHYDSTIGTALKAKKALSEILGYTTDFDTVKPVDLILELINHVSPSDTVLDFFAGSGTTLHAVMKLNAEDGGKRTCILVTNNENGICEKVTYERNRRVIQGYTNAKGEAVPGLQDNSLRYYKTEFVPRRPSPRNARALMAASVDLLCVKNDLYDEVLRFFGKKLKKSAGRYFDDGRGRRMLVLFDETTVPSVAETIRGASFKGKVKIYVFAHGDYAYNEEFEEVADKVELCALPAAIRNAYRRVIGKYRPQEEDAK